MTLEPSPPAALADRTAGSAARLGPNAVIALLASGLLGASSLLAGVCTVPGTHVSIAAASADFGCTEIQLAAQTYAESVSIQRSLTLSGVGGGATVVAGLLEARGVGVVVVATDLRVENGCQPAAAAAIAGARLDGTTLEVVASPGGPCPGVVLFLDDFESGNLGAWDHTVP